MNLAVVGCGNISPLYLTTLQNFPQLKAVACCDLDLALARRRAEEFGVPAVLALDEILARSDIDLVLNLTVPAAHAAVAAAALSSGKHVYNEKPLATTLEDARRLLALERSSGLRLGCAPSTFLGATVQTARKAIDEGLIGEPVGASAAMLSRGMEHWHPNPQFFYQPGAGPMFDLGPYYLSALVTLLGPVASVAGAARITFPEREVSSQPQAGQRFRVTTPTHIAGTLVFAGGPIATLTTSFDVWHSELPRFEVYGSEGSLSLEAPNVFGGAVRVRGAKDESWRALPLVHDRTNGERGWGLALADLAAAQAEGRAHRASSQLAYHVLELMHGFLRSAQEERHVRIESRCERPAALPDPTALDTALDALPAQP